MQNVTNEMIYEELKSIKKELIVLEHAVIPVERLSQEELETHKLDLKDAHQGERTNFRSI